jgi:hypothetical protein
MSKKATLRNSLSHMHGALSCHGGNHFFVLYCVCVCVYPIMGLGPCLDYMLIYSLTIRVRVLLSNMVSEPEVSSLNLDRSLICVFTYLFSRLRLSLYTHGSESVEVYKWIANLIPTV